MSWVGDYPLISVKQCKKDFGPEDVKGSLEFMLVDLVAFEKELEERLAFVKSQIQEIHTYLKP